MAKRSKSKPGSPTEQVPTGITCVQDNASESPVMDQEMNKPFMLALSVPHDKDMSAAFPCTMIEASIFPVDRDDKAMHTFIVNKITDMTCDAMKTYFMATSKIQDGIRCLVEGNYKCDATGKEYFQFLTSQCQSNCNIAITFAATCQQCLHSDSSTGQFNWVYPPDEFINHISDLMCFTLEDHPDNEFFDQAFPFLPADLRGAFQLHK